MQNHRKPRVFLSHSKKDTEFIKQIERDLRYCQCDPWIDDIEIRPGKPWLDEIFSFGIPNCEVVFCYITKNSLVSRVVQKEIDARIIERLQNDKVTLLIYLEDADLRQHLRLDLQSLHAPILNQSNYSQEFPRLVAEIWRSYSDFSILNAIQSEKVRRLEAEIKIQQLESLGAGSIFSERETSEFSLALPTFQPAAGRSSVWSMGTKSARPRRRAL